MRIQASLFFSIILSGSSFSQISIDMDDMPQAGDIYGYRTTETLIPAIDPADTGADYVWNHSLLGSEGNGTDTVFMVSETPLLYQFFFNNPFIYPDHLADLALETQGVNLGAVSISDVFTYYKNDNEGYKNVGFGANVNMLPASVQNIPVDVVYEFPLQYQDSSSSHSESELDIPGFGYYHHEQDREVVVEGWGSLMLPDSTYPEVLKVKTVVNAIDSIYSEQFMLGLSFPQPEVVTYQWLAPNGGLPILEISITGGFAMSIQYRSELVSGLTAFEIENIDVYPNPTDGFLHLDRALGTESWSSIQVYDYSGRLVLEWDDPGLILDLRTLSRGHYFLLLETENQFYSAPFSKN